MECKYYNGNSPYCDSFRVFSPFLSHDYEELIYFNSNYISVYIQPFAEATSVCLSLIQKIKQNKKRQDHKFKMHMCYNVCHDEYMICEIIKENCVKNRIWREEMNKRK